jgi:Cytochrome P460
MRRIDFLLVAVATVAGVVAQFNNGKPADQAVHQTCFSCHEPIKARDFVFTRYAP